MKTLFLILTITATCLMLLAGPALPARAADMEQLVDEFADISSAERYGFETDYTGERVHGNGEVSQLVKPSSETGFYEISTKIKLTPRGNAYIIVLRTKRSADVRYFEPGEWVKLSGNLSGISTDGETVSVRLKRW